MKAESADKTDMSKFFSELGLTVRATHVLFQMDLKSAADFAALDKSILLRRRNCGKKTAAEIMEVVAQYKSSTQVTSSKEMDAASVAAAMDHTPITELRLSVRAMAALEHLKISTVGQLAKASDSELLGVCNFGKKSLREVRSKLAALCSRGFVRWPSEQPDARGLSRQIAGAARKLRRLRNASALLSDDYQFGYLVRELGLQAKNAREAADIIISRNVDPVDAQPLIRRLTDLIGVINAGNRKFVEAELWNLTDGLGSNRNRRIILRHLGWDGSPPATLEAVGRAHNMTRERVRQICTRIETIRSAKPFAPAVDRALNVVARAAPTLATEIEAQLLRSRLTKTGFCVEALLATARDLGRRPAFTVEILHGHRVVVPAHNRGFLDRIYQVARDAIRRCGVATVEDVAAAAGAGVSLTQKLLPLFSGFRWLDESSGWFWIANTPRNSLLTQIRKILAASPCVDVGELRTGVGRHHRRKGFAPPRRVLLELCRQLPWCQVEDTTVAASESLDADQILSESEQIIVKVFKEHGTVLQKSKFEQLCVHAGMNPHSFSILLSYSPIVCRHAAGVYGLRGAEVPLGLVESLIPKRTSRSKLLLDYAWTNERNIQIIYKVSHGTLSNGIVSVPAALKAFLQGRFTLVAGDNSRIGTLVVKDGSAWGLGPFFSRRGGEPGDYLSIVFDLSRRCALVQIGDEDSIEQLRSAPSERYSADENVDEASITPTLPGRADLLLLEEPIRLCRMNEEWSDDEVRRTVIAYFDMLADELSKRPYNKAERRRLLIEHLHNRSHGAVERKHQNISAILDEMQFPYIDGYKPLRNYQASLKAGVDAYLSEHPKFFTKK